MVSQEVADRICEQIAAGRSLRAILREDEGMPASSTVFKALAEDRAFAEQYARAREAQADTLFDEILQISDASDEDVNRSRLRVDARKWMAGKLRPKVYGDKFEHEHKGSVTLAVSPVDEQL